MGNWHMEDLRHALEGKGWQILAEHPGDDYKISGSWEIRRSARRPPLFLDFDGLDDLNCLPMPQSYGCHLREQPGMFLYFYKQRSRAKWKEELHLFVVKLDGLEAAAMNEKSPAT